jgi:hypothetical protein
MSYDSHCYDLAQLFLPDGIDEKIIIELAEEIQTSIESFLSYGEHKDRIDELERDQDSLHKGYTWWGGTSDGHNTVSVKYGPSPIRSEVIHQLLEGEALVWACGDQREIAGIMRDGKLVEADT